MVVIPVEMPLSWDLVFYLLVISAFNGIAFHVSRLFVLLSSALETEHLPVPGGWKRSAALSSCGECYSLYRCFMTYLPASATCCPLSGPGRVWMYGNSLNTCNTLPTYCTTNLIFPCKNVSFLSFVVSFVAPPFVSVLNLDKQFRQGLEVAGAWCTPQLSLWKSLAYVILLMPVSVFWRICSLTVHSLLKATAKDAGIIPIRKNNFLGHHRDITARITSDTLRNTILGIANQGSNHVMAEKFKPMLAGKIWEDLKTTE